MSNNTALCIIGGGAAGSVTAPYLSAIEACGTKVDQIYGTSSGAINAATFHSYGAEALKDMWLRIRNKDVFRENPLTYAKAFGEKASFYDGSPLLKLLEQYINREVIQEQKASTPLFVSVTDIASERSISINLTKLKDDLAPWVFASASPPALFSPVKIGGKAYCDGGLGELVNISFAIKNGADTIIILCPRGVPQNTKFHNALDAVSFAIRMPLNYQLEKELRIIEVMNSHPEKRFIRTLLIRPDDNNQPGILDFDKLGTLEERRRKFLKYEVQALRALESFNI